MSTIDSKLAVLFATAVFSASLPLVSGCASTAPAPPVARPAAPAPLVQRFASEPAPAPRFLDPERGRKLRAATAEVQGLAQRTAERERLPALALGVVIDEDLAIQKITGVRDIALGGAVDEHTRFRVGSITKTLTAEAILRLRDEGRLSIDAPAARYLPALAGVVYPTRDSRPMTVRDLLTHSSGLPRLGVFSPASTARDVTEREILATLDGFGLESAPGTATWEDWRRVWSSGPDPSATDPTIAEYTSRARRPASFACPRTGRMCSRRPFGPGRRWRSPP